MDAKEIGLMLHHVKAGADIKKAAFEVPLIDIEASIQPITRTVLRVRLVVEPKFRFVWKFVMCGYDVVALWQGTVA